VSAQTKVDFETLVIQLPASYFIEYHKKKRLARFLGCSPLRRFAVKGLAKVFPHKFVVELRNLALNYAHTEKYIEILRDRESKEGAANFGSEYGYKDDELEFAVAKYYKKQLLDRDAKPATESFDLYDHAVGIVAALLTEDSLIAKTINFGVSYAHVDSILARMFPDRLFVGVDRSNLTKQFNYECFGDLSNISFEAENIMEYLEADHSGSILFHMRTCTVLPQSFVEALYEKASRANVRYIVGMEQIGVSRQTDQPYRFSEGKQDSVVFRSFMHIHNYPGILREYGYDLERIELVKTAHSDEDYRLLSFTAKKRDVG